MWQLLLSFCRQLQNCLQYMDVSTDHVSTYKKVNVGRSLFPQSPTLRRICFVTNNNNNKKSKILSSLTGCSLSHRNSQPLPIAPPSPVSTGQSKNCSTHLHLKNMAQVAVPSGIQTGSLQDSMSQSCPCWDRSIASSSLQKPPEQHRKSS